MAMWKPQSQRSLAGIHKTVIRHYAAVKKDES